MEFDPQSRAGDQIREGRAELRRALRRRPLPVVVLAGPEGLPPLRFVGWEASNNVVTSVRVDYGTQVSVETGRWSGARVESGSLRELLEHHMREHGDRSSDVEWVDDDRTVTVDGRAVTGRRLRAGDRWWAVRCSLRDLEISVVAHDWHAAVAVRTLSPLEVDHLVSQEPAQPQRAAPERGVAGSGGAEGDRGVAGSGGAEGDRGVAGSGGGEVERGVAGFGGAEAERGVAGSGGAEGERGAASPGGAVPEAAREPGEPHRLLVDAVLRSERERSQWMAAGGPAPQLPQHWAQLWRDAVRRQADLAAQSEPEAQRSLQSIISQLSTLHHEAEWFRTDEALRERAISETLLFGTGLSPKVPSRTAQVAWLRRQGMRPAEVARIEAVSVNHGLWLDEWNAWARRSR